jgi:hypothetical protein
MLAHSVRRPRRIYSARAQARRAGVATQRLQRPLALSQKNFRDPTCRRGLVLRYNRAQCLMLDPNPVSRSATLHLFPIQSAEPG